VSLDSIEGDSAVEIWPSLPRACSLLNIGWHPAYKGTKVSSVTSGRAEYITTIQRKASGVSVVGLPTCHDMAQAEQDMSGLKQTSKVSRTSDDNTLALLKYWVVMAATYLYENRIIGQTLRRLERRRHHMPCDKSLFKTILYPLHISDAVKTPRPRHGSDVSKMTESLLIRSLLLGTTLIRR
jgi:hypothetical protein